MGEFMESLGYDGKVSEGLLQGYTAEADILQKKYPFGAKYFILEVN